MISSTNTHLLVSIVVITNSDDGRGMTRNARCESTFGFNEKDLEDPIRFVSELKQEIEKRKKEARLT
jgi:hypothetical protein